MGTSQIWLVSSEEEEKTATQGEDHVETESEIGVMCLQAKEHQILEGIFQGSEGKDKEGRIPPRVSEGAQAC